MALGLDCDWEPKHKLMKRRVRWFLFLITSNSLLFFQEVKAPTLLEEDSTADEVMPALTKIGITLTQCRARVLQVQNRLCNQFMIGTKYALNARI